VTKAQRHKENERIKKLKNEGMKKAKGKKATRHKGTEAMRWGVVSIKIRSFYFSLFNF